MSRRHSSDACGSQTVGSTPARQAQQPGTQPVSAPAIEDLRDLEAPEPLERILAATAKLAPGEAYSARVPRYPRLLLPRLEERGLLYEVVEEPDATALVHVRRPA